MLDQNPFDEVLIPKSKRRQFLGALFEYFLTRDLFAAVITGHREKRFNQLLATENQKECLYVCRAPGDAALIVNLLLGIRPWHKGKFCILICSPQAIQEIIERPDSIAWPIPQIAAGTKGRIYGYIFPLDDLLVCYGDTTVEQGVQQALGDVDSVTA